MSDQHEELRRLIKQTMLIESIEHKNLMRKAILTLILCVAAFFAAVWLDNYLVARVLGL